MFSQSRCRILLVHETGKGVPEMGLFKQIKNLGSVAAESERADLTPIAGVSLELYAEIARSVLSGGDRAHMSLLAAAKGISVADWDAAVEGWKARILTQPGVAQELS